MQRRTEPAAPTGATRRFGLGALDRDRGKKALPTHLRNHNLSLLLRTLYVEGPLTRAELARATKITKVTISVLVAELLSHGIVVELGQAEEENRVGKPGVKLDLARHELLVGGLDLSHGDQFRGQLFNLDLEVVHETTHDVAGTSGDDALQVALDMARELATHAGDRLVGIGVGAPGQVSRRGTVIYSTRLGWRQLPLAELLEEACGCDVWVENDANAATLAEESQRGQAEDLLVVSLWSGIGAGLVLDGELIRGRNSAVGEIGQLHLPGFPPEETLEYWLAEKFLGARLAAAAPSQRETVLTEAGEKLGLFLAPVVATLNITNVILSTPPHIDSAVLSRVVQEVLRQQTTELTHRELQVSPSLLGAEGVMVGAAHMVLRSFLGVGAVQ